MNLITWNIQRGRGPDGKCSIERTIADLRSMANFDVLCLQEVSSGFTDLSGCDGNNQFVDLARNLPTFTPVAAVATDILDESGSRCLFGNMILSRFPVIQVFRHALPWPVDAAVMSMQRVALEVTLDTPLGLVRVTTTHLEYFSARQRAAQIEYLRLLHHDASLHARSARPGAPSAGPFRTVPRAAAAILTGDCNFLPGSNGHRRIQAPFDDDVPAYRDAWNLLHPARPHAPTVGLRNPDEAPFTFDYIFVSEQLALRTRAMHVGADIAGPDHQPVMLTLA